MQTDAIKAVGIDENGSLWVKPAAATFPPYAPKPREWSYVAWFKQIIKAAREQNVSLTLELTTSWSGIDDQLKQDIASVLSEGK